LIGPGALVGWAHPMVRNPKTAWQGALDGQSSTAQRRAPRASRATAGGAADAAIADFLQAAADGSADDRPAAVDLEAVVDELAATGLSRRRLRAVAKSLRALFHYASERDDAEQPSRSRPPASHLRSLASGADRATAGIDSAIALGLQVITVCFVLLALVLIAESL
jgi:hypothetical protein